MAHRKRSKGRKRKYQVYARKTTRRRRSRRAKQGLLFDSGSGKANVAGMLRTAGAAAIGGAISRFTYKVTRGKRVPLILASLAESFVATKFLKSPAMSAGIMGAAAFVLLIDVPFLSEGMENHDYVDQDLLNDLPMYLDENGNEMIQGDDGQFYYLEESPYALSQNQQFENVYPGYVNPGFYDR